MTTTPRTNSTSPAARPEHRNEQAHLSQRYGTIGIQAVAAAARYTGKRENRDRPSAPVSRIDLRFVESAH